MKRYITPAVGATLAMLAALSLSAGRAEAQTALSTVPGGNFLNDPFSFYYAVYLPNQQLQAMRPTPLDSVNDALVTRQYYSQGGSRRSLYDPISPYAESYDPLRPFSSQEERLSRPYRFQRDSSNTTGMGPSLYYNRIAQYYPDMGNRTGRTKNANVATRRASSRMGRGGGGMGGGGMGGMGRGMGGMGGGMGMGMPGMGMF